MVLLLIVGSYSMCYDLARNAAQHLMDSSWMTSPSNMLSVVHTLDGML